MVEALVISSSCMHVGSCYDNVGFHDLFVVLILEKATINTVVFAVQVLLMVVIMVIPVWHAGLSYVAECTSENLNF